MGDPAIGRRGAGDSSPVAPSSGDEAVGDRAVGKALDGGSRSATRSVWLDSVRGLCVFAMVLLHASWLMESAAGDYWSPARRAWEGVNHLDIRMPLLLVVSGMLASKAIRAGIHVPKVRLRVAANYYLYVIWVGVLALMSFLLPAGELPHRLHGMGDALGELVVPETPLWYVMALALYSLVLAVLASVRPSVVLSVLLIVSVTSHMYATPYFWGRMIFLMFFFALGVYATQWLWRVERWATVPRGLALALAGVVPAMLILAVPSGSLQAGVLAFTEAGTLGLAAFVLMARAVRLRPVAVVGAFVGQRTLAVYTTSTVILWVLILGLQASPHVMSLTSVPAVALVAPLVVAAAVTGVGLVARPALEKVGLGWLFAMPASWEAFILE